ncbi:MAG: hypothetical protein AAF363_16125 [Bacteroidota bacterium]
MEKTRNDLWKAIIFQVIGMIVAFICATLFLSSCTDECTSSVRYSYFEPVYMPFEELRASVEVLPPQEIEAAGKIYFNSGYLYVNEPGKGIHIINNQNAENPIAEGFINIPGNYELASIDNFLYADSYVDLVVLDISDKSNPKEVDRLENVFQNMSTLGFFSTPEQGVVVDWVDAVSENEISSECGGSSYPEIYYHDAVFFRTDGGVLTNSVASAAEVAAIGVATSGVNVGGSAARFAIAKNQLYVVDSWRMFNFSIENRSDPTLSSTTDLGWGIETIFPYHDNLFLGANNGMHIYDISNPTSPSFLSTYTHITSCDPVVVQGDIAYVTLRSGTTCQGFTNQLDVIDVSDLSNPSLIKSYGMINPHGLGIDGNRLFLCEGESGLKVLDASDENDITLLQHFDNFHAFDVIPLNGVLMLTGNDGIYQYRYNGESVELISQINVTGPSI